MKNLVHFGATAITVLVFALAGAADVLRAPAVTASIQGLGYPPYLLTILGVWKLLGSAALVIPRLPRLKEWAYAGMFFDLTGAAMSHAACGSSLGQILPPLAVLGVVMTSWYLRPAPGAAVTKPVDRVHAM